jgi:hypothetical protein
MVDDNLPATGPAETVVRLAPNDRILNARAGSIHSDQTPRPVSRVIEIGTAPDRIVIAPPVSALAHLGLDDAFAEQLG